MPALKRLLLCLLALALIALPAAAKLEEKEWSRARAELEQGLASSPPNADAIAGAVQKIGADQSKRAVDLLIKVGAGLDDIKVYEAVKAALSGMSEGEAVAAMVKGLKDSGDWRIRCVLVDAMSSVQGDGVTEGIAAALKDKVPYVTSAAAKSLGRRKNKDSIQPLIDRLKELEKSKDVVWVDVKQALTDITGQDHADAKEWQFWWDGVKTSFDPAKDRGDKKESTTSLRPGEESGSFFSEPIVAKRIMFVIDVSGSMDAADIPVEGKGTQKRIQVAKDELIRCIKGLKKDVKFNIIAFDHKVKFWQKIVKDQPALRDANPGAKEDAIKWVTQMKHEGATHTDEALKKAFEPLEVNQIVLLSDGSPARFPAGGGGQATPIPTGPILEMVQGLNRLRGVKINTFCFAVFQRMQGAEPLLQFMEDLAKQNGGKLTLCGGGGLPKQPDPPKEPDPPADPPQNP